MIFLFSILPGSVPGYAEGEVNLPTTDEFGEGEPTTISTLSREGLPPPGDQDSYVIFGLAPSTDDTEHFLTETTEEAHYFVTIRTNQGWGEFPGETLDYAQAFGFGDAWDVLMDTGAVVLDDSNTGDTVTSTSVPSRDLRLRLTFPESPSGSLASTPPTVNPFTRPSQNSLDVNNGSVGPGFGIGTVVQGLAVNRTAIDFDFESQQQFGMTVRFGGPSY